MAPIVKPFPQYFQQQTSPALANYDYFDIAEGTGVKAFYLAVTRGNTNGVSTSGSILTAQQVYSYHQDATHTGREEAAAVNNPGDSVMLKALDTDFDLSPFNLPKNIRGTAYAQIPFLLDGQAGTQSGSIAVRIRKWDGTTETTIGSGDGEVLTAAAAADAYMLNLITIPLTTTHFAKGDILRATIECSGSSTTAGNNPILWIAHDPQNGDSSVFTAAGGRRTQAVLYIPFDLNIG